MNFLEKSLMMLCRLYPLKSGCGSIANSGFFKAIENGGQKSEWVNVKGGQAFVPVQDFVGRSMKYFGDLDPKVSDIIDKVVREGDTCLDIGANLGLISVRMSDRVGRTGQVHAFEPQPEMIGHLRETFSRLAHGNVTLHDIGLGRSADTLQLTVPQGNAGAATLTSKGFQNSDTIEVDVRSLDSVAQEYSIGPVSLVKIDVEGFEAEVVAGGAEFFRDVAPSVVIFEERLPHDQGQLPPSLQLFHDLEYEIFALPKVLFATKIVPIHDCAQAHDYVAVSKTAPQEVRRRLGI
ncbi:FkbM family methyltransferase [Roseovarius sp. EL26]|uniref:FkbM family methyltransferase n=1 Tax=Roseovarius sp. EL26 TaxID=2126672 RepID=UPI000EA0C6E1|nr:FkbM family methyltransferase [Roseovarius sp. EL26]